MLRMCGRWGISFLFVVLTVVLVALLYLYWDISSVSKYQEQSGQSHFIWNTIQFDCDGAFYRDASENRLVIKAQVPVPKIRFKGGNSAQSVLTLKNIPVDKLKILTRGLEEVSRDKTSVTFRMDGSDEGYIETKWAKKGTNFLVWGDSRTSPLPYSKYHYNFRELLRKVGEEDAYFAVLMGDAVNHGYDWELRWLIKRIEVLPFPVYVLPGNEDISAKDGYDNFKRYLGKNTAAEFTLGSAWFAFLDSARSYLTEESMEIVKAGPDTGTMKTSFLFVHHPVFDPLGPGRKDIITKPEQVSELLRTASGWPNPVFFLAHIHGYYFKRINGIDCYISGGGGHGLAEPVTFYHYLKVKTDSQGKTDVLVKKFEDKLSTRKLFLFLLLLFVLAATFVVFRVLKSVRK